MAFSVVDPRALTCSSSTQLMVATCPVSWIVTFLGDAACRRPVTRSVNPSHIAGRIGVHVSVVVMQKVGTHCAANIGVCRAV